MKMNTLGDFKGQPGVVVQTENGTRFMIIQLAAGMITSGDQFGGEEKTAVVRLQTGHALFWSDRTEVELLSVPPVMNGIVTRNTGERKTLVHPQELVEQRAPLTMDDAGRPQPTFIVDEASMPRPMITSPRVEIEPREITISDPAHRRDHIKGGR